MTLRLILIRHGKSSWDDPFADDHARVLNERGRASATAIGGWLADKGYVPQAVLCSDAARTQETAKLILPHLRPAPTLRLSKRLYLGAPETMMDLIKDTEAAVIAVIAHNPGLGILANALVKAAPAHPRFHDYPTCATTVIDFKGAIAARKGTCVDFVVPRDLIGPSG